jgi:hypothetical protein
VKVGVVTDVTAESGKFLYDVNKKGVEKHEVDSISI